MATTIGVKLVKHEEAQVLEYGIANGPLPNTGQKQLKHHVVGQKDLGRLFAHALARLLLLLAGVLTEGNRKLSCARFVVVLVAIEFFRLRVDQRVHRIDHDSCHPR